MSRPVFAALLCIALAGASFAARAGAPGDEDSADRSASDLALEGLDRLMQALGVFIDSIPQYEAPFINEDGDIIIRRKRDHDAAPAPDGEPPALSGPGGTTRI